MQTVVAEPTPSNILRSGMEIFIPLPRGHLIHVPSSDPPDRRDFRLGLFHLIGPALNPEFNHKTPTRAGGEPGHPAGL